MWGWWAGDGFNAKPALTIVGIKALAEFGKKKKKNNGENSVPMDHQMDPGRLISGDPW